MNPLGSNAHFKLPGVESGKIARPEVGDQVAEAIDLKDAAAPHLFALADWWGDARAYVVDDDANSCATAVEALGLVGLKASFALCSSAVSQPSASTP